MGQNCEESAILHQHFCGTINFFHVFMPSPTFQLFIFFLVFLFLPWIPFQPLSPFFLGIMADQLSFSSLFFTSQSFLMGNGRLYTWSQPHVDPFSFFFLIHTHTHTHTYIYIYIYILITFLVSPYYLVHSITVTVVCVAVQVYLPVTHFFQFQHMLFVINIIAKKKKKIFRHTNHPSSYKKNKENHLNMFIQVFK